MKEDAYQINAIKLAYIGDAVFSLFIREYFVKNFEKKNRDINKEVNKIVCAKNQAKLMEKLFDGLNEKESDIVLRARNLHLNNKAKNSSFSEYHQATQFEALIGYLYLNKENARLENILNFSINEFLTEGEN